MIPQARITSPTTATIHLADGTTEITGENIAEVRTKVKQAFIAASREAHEPIDVVIVESGARHHLVVEHSGRIAQRPADDRPLFGEDAASAESSAREQGTADDAAAETAPAQASPSEAPSAEQPSASADMRSSAAADAAAAPFAPLAGGYSPEPVLPGAAPQSAPAPSSVGAAPAADTIPGGSVPLAPTGPLDAGARGESADSGTILNSGDAAGTEVAGAADEVPVSEQAAADAAPSGFVPVAPPAPVEPESAPTSAPSAAAPANASAAATTSSVTASSPAAPPASAQHPSASPAPAMPAVGATASAPVGAPDRGRPTLQDLQEGTRRNIEAPPTKGWQGAVARLTGGRVSPALGREEREEREDLARVTRALDGPKNIAVVNLKGGAHKTTASLMIAATLGSARGGGVLAWDNNETRGTLGWRGTPGQHSRTAVDLLHNLEDLRDATGSVSELDRYVRPQGETKFDILASDEDPGSAALVDGEAFRELDETLSRFYRLKVIDTGNNVRAANWLAAVHSADQLVIVSTLREDTFNAAAWMIDELRATGLGEQVDSAVTILSHNSTKKVDPLLRTRLLQHFGAHTRAIVEVPFEPQFVDGSPLDWPRIQPATKRAWLRATAAIVDGL